MMRSLRVSAALLLICVALAVVQNYAQETAQSQATAPAAPEIPASASEPIWKAQDAIYKARPEIQASTLDQDRAALGKAYEGVWSQSGSPRISDADAGMLLAAVWRDYRIAKPKSTSHFDEAKVIDLANAYGGLHVITHPRGASVWVDERLYDGHTSLTAFMRAGRRKIRVGGLPGYKDDEESVVVVAASIAEFERHLTKTK